MAIITVASSVVVCVAIIYVGLAIARSISALAKSVQSANGNPPSNDSRGENTPILPQTPRGSGTRRESLDETPDSCADEVGVSTKKSVPRPTTWKEYARLGWRKWTRSVSWFMGYALAPVSIIGTTLAGVPVVPNFQMDVHLPTFRQQGTEGREV